MGRNQKNIVSTIIYDGIDESFIKDFLTSLSKQDDMDFDLMVIAQNLSASKINNLIKKYSPIFIDQSIIIETDGSDYHKLLMKNNMQRYSTAYDMGYDYIIGVDSDDILLRDYISSMKSEIKKHDADVVFCDLNKFSKKSNLNKDAFVFGDSIEHGQEITTEMLRTGNCTGFGNNIGKTKILRDASRKFKRGNEALDWLLASIIAEDGGKIIHTKNAYINYRIHPDNMSSLGHQDIEQVNRSIGIICDHFNQLSEISSQPALTQDLRERFNHLCIINQSELNNILMEINNDNNRAWWYKELKIHKHLMK